MIASLKTTEDGEQQAVIEWAEANKGNHPELALLHHIPNGGHRNKATAARLQRLGVKSGVPDLFLPVARAGFHGLYVELKTRDGKVTANQREWLEKLNAQGYCARACFGSLAATELIDLYLKGIPDWYTQETEMDV